MSETIVHEVWPGDSIEETCRRAMDRAEALRADVQFVFNGVLVVVRFAHTPLGLVQKYLEDLAGVYRSQCPGCSSIETVGTATCSNCHAKLKWIPTIRL